MASLSSAEKNSGKNHAAQAVVQKLNATNRKVIAMKERRLKNPNTLGDLIIKSAIPSFATFIAGEVASAAWKHYLANPSSKNKGKFSKNSKAGSISELNQTSKADKNNNSKKANKSNNSNKKSHQDESLLMSLGLAIFSAIITTLVGRVAGHGTSKFIAHRQRKRKLRSQKRFLFY